MHWLDYSIFTALVAVSLLIGLYHAFSGGRQRSTEEYIMADRRLRVFPTILSLCASHSSAISILGISAETYYGGVQFCVMSVLGHIISILVAERVLVPWIYPLKLTSVFEYFELRYSSKALRMFAAFLGLLSAMLFMGMVIYAPSIALEIATGLPKTVSIPLMAVSCAAYVFLGGMKAVIWTDVIQFVVLIGGLFTIIIKEAISGSGLNRTLSTAGEVGRLQWVNFSFDPTERHTLWGFMFGFTLSVINAFGLNQASVQRYSAVDTLAKARWTLLLVIPVLAFNLTCIGIIGLQLLDHYVNKVGCDPLGGGRISHPNEILPDYVKTVFVDVKGFSGIFLATLYSGALSSISSIVSGAAANTSRDMLANISFVRNMSDRTATMLNKILVVLLCALSAGIAFMAVHMPGPVIQANNALIGGTGGPLFGMFLLGGLFRLSEWKGTLIGAAAGLSFTLWLILGSMTIKGQNELLPPTTTANCTPAVNLTAPPPHSVMSSPVLFIADQDVCKDNEARAAHRANIPEVAFIRWRDIFTFSRTSAEQEQLSDVAELKSLKSYDVKAELKMDVSSGPLLNQKI